jgi:endoglucanase
MRRVRLLLPLLFCLGYVDSRPGAAEPPGEQAGVTVLDHAARLGGGINLASALDAPREGDWGVTLEDADFQRIAQAGFQSVRVPIRWSAQAAGDAPFAIEAELLARVDWVLQQSHRHHLAVILALHPDEELLRDPAAQRERFLAIWQQIAARYQTQPADVYFEPLSQPGGGLDAPLWNSLLADVLREIRATNATRPVIIGPADQYSVAALASLQLPDDPWLVATIHYDTPREFTRQGEERVENSSQWLGRAWPASEAEERQVALDFQAARDWSDAHQTPIVLGAFGVSAQAPAEARARWTATVARAAEAHRMPWLAWEFAGGSGLLDRKTRAWNESLLKTLGPVNRFDVNQDGRTTRDDFQQLTRLLAKPTSESRLDLNRDGLVDARDLRFWSYFAGPYSGDFDASGAWDAQDIDLLSEAVREKSDNQQFDISRDGIVSDEDRRVWVEVVMQTYFGDANLDGSFDSIDAVGIFATGQYEDQIPANSGWAQGDFNGDHEFTTADFTLAMQTGAYEKGKRGAQGQDE